ncbi:DUF1385 domain-containing protein [Pseudalkalibacillus salsuginis]|uniref:DUF1385 domain-containing protein n=1 Tax=Pseudalkalibacillus salsuginis TaxID=2910972 RepID=UPI001F207F8A|nr:DUF1385 domain-containing protein [Pseudalkalibacillus salsuginis]MCF6411438.1 DUF1385 domain-containing protein [Pseudalkalibacillus salsuginis]
MQVYKGGAAGLNSVLFIGKKFRVKAIYNNGSFQSKVEAIHNNEGKLDSVLNKIPFVRGVWSIVKAMMNVYKQLILAFATLLLAGKVLPSGTSTSRLPLLEMEWLFSFAAIALAAVVIKFTSISKYHAAEHMVAHCEDKNLPLTYENVAKQPRVHPRCGTNLVVFIIFNTTILSFFMENMVLNMLIAWSIGYEMFRMKRSRMTLFYKVGSFLQYVCFTSKPEEKHLNIAIESMKTLKSVEA